MPRIVTSFVAGRNYNSPARSFFPGVRLICIVALHSFYLTGKFPLSPFKTKEQAEKAREKYPERQRKTIFRARPGGTFVVSRAGEAYEARNRGPNRKPTNRKPRLTSEGMYRSLLLL